MQGGRSVHMETTAQQALSSVVGLFLLAREITGAGNAQGFDALAELYDNLHVLNREMSRRLGSATHSDPARNAMALLDAHATLLPVALDDSLDELRPLFDAWETGKILSFN